MQGRAASLRVPCKARLLTLNLSAVSRNYWDDGEKAKMGEEVRVPPGAGGVRGNPFTAPGRFVVGCNYWASHAGTRMWSDWRADVVEDDLRRLSEAGLQVLRVFPLWPDFQPITLHRGFEGRPVEVRLREEPLQSTEEGRAGIDPGAMARFDELVGMAGRHRLLLNVALITGWMSGRLFVPPALEGRNVLTDALALQWQVRLVRCFARRYRGCPTIVAWSLGNECNCMGHASRAEAWNWTAAISNALRADDPDRPIVSGMHGLSPAPDADWSIQDQGELLDVLTVHPYPLFTPHCGQEPLNTMRPCLHATAEARLYADVGGRPVLVDEIGTLGPMVSSEEVAADYLKTCLFSLWAHDCHGALWWCAFDQVHLEHAPYDWTGLERELGLMRTDKTAKPVLRVLGEFRRLVEGLAIRELPPRRTEAVCILTHGQDQWGVAYSSFILAEQAGFDVVFRYEDQPLPDAAVYMLPSIAGMQVISRRNWLRLMERVQAGATLYVSHQSGLLQEFEKWSGLEVVARSARRGPACARIALNGHAFSLTVQASGAYRLDLCATRAEVLGQEDDGNPAFARARYGEGHVYFMSLPLEASLAREPGAFESQDAGAAWRVYRAFGAPALAARAVVESPPPVGITEHVLAGGSRVAVAINYGPSPTRARLGLAAGWRLEGVWHGGKPEAGPGWLLQPLPANDAAILLLARA